MALYKTFKSMNGGENKEENNYQVLNINTTQERLNHIGSHKIIVINYHTDWCGPCKSSAGEYAKLAQKYSKPGFCMLLKENAEIAENLPSAVTGVPCFHFYLNGQHIPDATVTGADIPTVEQNINNFLNNTYSYL